MFLNVELKAVGNEKRLTKDRDGNNTVKKWDGKITGLYVDHGVKK